MGWRTKRGARWSWSLAASVPVRRRLWSASRSGRTPALAVYATLYEGDNIENHAFPFLKDVSFN